MFMQDRADGSGPDGAGQRLMTSASDLTAASSCEFAFLRRVDARLGRDVIVPPDDDPMLARAARLGDAHEERVLGAYLARFGGADPGRAGGVAEIARCDPRDEAALEAAAAETLAALGAGADVVFQATFFDPAQRPAAEPGDPDIGFLGFADFLRRGEDGAYEVQDTKLARRAKVTALMQLAAYAEQLERIGVPVSDEAVLILGDGARSRHRIADIAPVFRSRRERLHRILLERVRAKGPDGRRESAPAIEWGTDGIAVCGRCEVCEPEIVRTRDPLLIADIRRGQRDRLVAAGLDTIDRIAGLAGVGAGLSDVGLPDVPGVSSAALEGIAAQAAAQLHEGSGGAPWFRVADPQALAAIPRPDAGDLFFDFEGDPLFREAGEDGAARWGLDYLFGMVDAEERFTALWAHDLDAERRALERFLAIVADRRRQHPGMRVYHYAAYERTHLLSIAARHGVGEAEVDRLLREHVLVDLYPIVRKALRVGSRSYSIKKLEPLYMGEELRDEEGVTSAAQSVTEYAEATALLASAEPGEQAEGRRRLDAIADYNRYDCVSTLRLRDWLLGLAAERGVEPHPEAMGSGEGDDGPELELSALGAALAVHASLAEDPRDRRAAALAGSAIDYHQREQKSFWWAHYARLSDPIEDWADTRDVMVVDAAASSVEQDWRAPEGRERKHRRILRLRGEIAPGSSLREGSDAYVLYDYPPPFPADPTAAPGARGTRMVRILERHDDGATVEETSGGDAPASGRLPVALTPGPPPRPGAQKPAIEEWGRELARALDDGHFLPDPVVDIMRRVPPRLSGGEGLIDPASPEALAAAGGDEEGRIIGAVVGTLRRLDRSAIAVQGPPGTGKTYLAARVIRALVEQHGWRIGVVAQSHRVVENVLAGVVAAGLDPAQVGKAQQRGASDAGPPPYTVLRAGEQARFIAAHRAAGRGGVIGGTAWDFSNPGRVERRGLDLLVVDEAGQFSLAPTIAASMAAQRVLLLGDPQQLPQVSQGSHPEPVDASALGWLLGEHDTIPEGAGYFLAETRRMRPELAEIVSELAYEGRLRAHPTASLREVRGAGPAGLHWHPVVHSGNSTHSTEEAAEVVRTARKALGGTISEPGLPERALSQSDIIVVAPYNAQVECVAEALAAAGLPEIRVGTVDKFQGQEAAVAIVTLAASSPEDVPRGLEFLLMRNRLNVAISRAQWAAHLVSSERLGDGLPGTSEGLAALSGYLRLLERATVHPAARIRRARGSASG